MPTTVFDEDFDVVVLGTGAAGATAAIAAHDAGARVAVLEKTDRGNEGGSTRVSGGAHFVNLDPARSQVYLQAMSDKNPIPDDVAEAWSRETAKNITWLDSMGANLQPVPGYTAEFPDLPGADCYGGYVAVDGQMGREKLFKFLREQLESRKISIRYETPAKELVTTPDGAVVGVVAEYQDRLVRLSAAGGVVLATGGFQANDELRRQFLRVGGDGYVWGSAASTGDGLKMAMSVGADLWHMDNMMAVPGVRAPGAKHGYFQQFLHHPGWIWVAPDGRRFADESVPIGHGIVRRNGYYDLALSRFTHIIFDETTRAAGPICLNEAVLPVGWKILVEGEDWSNDNLTEIERGWITKADTVPELAEKIGVPAAALVETIATFNSACATGHDAQFGRPASRMAALDRGPFYAVSDWPMMGWTNGGPRRDGRSRVLRPSGEPIPGLYAAGEVSSTYSWGKDGGFHIADAIAFGRIAGQEAAERATQTQPPQHKQQTFPNASSISTPSYTRSA